MPETHRRPTPCSYDVVPDQDYVTSSQGTLPYDIGGERLKPIFGVEPGPVADYCKISLECSYEEDVDQTIAQLRWMESEGEAIFRVNDLPMSVEDFFNNGRFISEKIESDGHSDNVIPFLTDRSSV